MIIIAKAVSDSMGREIVSCGERHTVPTHLWLDEEAVLGIFTSGHAAFRGTVQRSGLLYDSASLFGRVVVEDTELETEIAAEIGERPEVRKCFNWLVGEMRAGPRKKDYGKDGYRREAKTRFGTTKTKFHDLWERAATHTGDPHQWRKGGPGKG